MNQAKDIVADDYTAGRKSAAAYARERYDAHLAREDEHDDPGVRRKVAIRALREAKVKFSAGLFVQFDEEGIPTYS